MREFILSHLLPGDVIGLTPFQTVILDQAAGFTGEQSFTAAGIAELATKLPS